MFPVFIKQITSLINYLSKAYYGVQLMCPEQLYLFILKDLSSPAKT